MDWQPIETLPREGEFLVVVKGKVFSAYKLWGDSPLKAEYSNEPFTDQPTHWMPLPSPPEA